MDSHVKLGHIRGIPIGLHPSWFLIFGLATWSLAVGYFPKEYPTLSPAAYWLLAGITSVLFFGSVLVHELGHAIVALRNRIPVHGITLFLFGGVAQIEHEPSTPGAEFRIAIAGPLTSLALAGVFGGLWLLDRHIPYLAAPSLWLMRLNLLLAFFNLIPGHPLDGGRVLRAVIWRMTGSFQGATLATSFVGQIAAVGLVIGGIFALMDGWVWAGMWLIVIGLFLQSIARVRYRQAKLQQTLQGVTAAQVMTPDHPEVCGELSLEEWIEAPEVAEDHPCLFVSENGRPRGMFTLHDIAKVPIEMWDRVKTEQVMVPWDAVVRVHADTELLDALHEMDEAGVDQVPVVADGAILGVLSRKEAHRFVDERVDFEVSDGELLWKDGRR